MSDPATVATIRGYNADDLSSLVALFRASVRILARDDYTVAQLEAWAPDIIDADQFAQRHIKKGTCVAEHGGRIAGFADLEPDGHIDMLYVHPDFHRRGVGLALLAHIEDLARCQGLDRLYTEASITARTVFERCGFRVFAEQTVWARNVSMTNYRMEKLLNTSAATL